MVKQISAELAEGTRIIRTARLVGVGVGTAQKIKASLSLGVGMP